MAYINEIEIYQVTVEQGDGGSYCVSAYWKTKESPQKYQGSYHVEITSLASMAASVDVEKKGGKIADVKLDPETFYTLKVTADGKSDTAPLLTHTYENARGNYDGMVLRLRWDTLAADIRFGKCIVSVEQGGSFTYDIPPYALGLEQPMKEELYGQNVVLSVSLQPFSSKVSSGPVVTLPELYRSRYMVTTKDQKVQICYKAARPDETSVNIPLEGEIYVVDAQKNSAKPAEPVTEGPLELGITQPYMLRINTGTLLDRRDYDSFIAKIYRVVTTAAMYDILEIITRCAFHAVEDSLYFHCGLRPVADSGQTNVNQRCADVRPGFTLRLEQEMYMPKEQISGDDAAGFVGTHTAEYAVSLAQGKDMQYLEFDSFISQMDEEIYSPADGSAVTPVSGGIIDLCAVRRRSAFYRIQYPEAMFSSDALPDVYEGNHTLLVADPGWKYASLESYLLFRGRSALTLLISVVVNGREQKVPAGTTFGKLLNSMGIYGLRTNRMTWYRRDPFGAEAEIVFEKDILKDMPLLNGDRIEG